MARRPFILAGLWGLLLGVVAACWPTGGLQAPPAARIECVGVPAARCQEIAAEVRGGSPVPLSAIRVRCLTPSCTDAGGEVEITAWRADGSVETSGGGWATPVGTPPGPQGGGEPWLATPPVTPVCIGLPAPTCEDLAADVMTFIEGLDGDAVVSITVRCTSVCTPLAGEGLTVVLVRDGERHELGWGYGGAPPGPP